MIMQPPRDEVLENQNQACHPSEYQNKSKKCDYEEEKGTPQTKLPLELNFGKPQVQDVLMGESEAKGNQACLSQRKDVVNKTLIRAVKRFYASRCVSNKDETFKGHDSTAVCAKIDAIVHERFKCVHSPDEFKATPTTYALLHDKNALTNQKYLTLQGWSTVESLKTFIAFLVIPQKCSKIRGGIPRRFYDSYKRTICAYSNKKLKFLLEIKTFALIAYEFLTSKDFIEMAAECATMRRNIEQYFAAAEETIKIIKHLVPASLAHSQL